MPAPGAARGEGGLGREPIAEDAVGATEPSLRCSRAGGELGASGGGSVFNPQPSPSWAAQSRWCVVALTFIGGNVGFPQISFCCPPLRQPLTRMGNPSNTSASAERSYK